MSIFNLQRFQDINIGTGVSNSVVSGTNDNDSIYNEGGIITIQAAGGDDTIYNKGQIVKIYGGDGNDSINNDSGKTVTIFSGAGDDIVRNGQNDGIIISTSDGNDKIYNNRGNKVSISAGAGDDYIYSSNYSWYSGGWNHSGGENVTINSGTGNDTIDLLNTEDNDRSYLESPINNVIQYTQGDGIDVIYGFNSSDTLQIAAQSMETMSSGSDFFVIFDNGSITLKYAASQVSETNLITVKGGSSGSDDSDSGVVSKNQWKVNNGTATYGNDSKTFIQISGLKSNATADGLSLKNKKVTISANIIGSDGAEVKGAGYNFALDGAGKLKNIGGKATLTGSTGRDSLAGGSGNDTLSGGKGNDTLTGGAGKDVFIYTGGGDVITDYTSGIDKIKISQSYTGTVKGSDVILTTANGGKITIKGAVDKEITFLNKNNKTSKDTFSADTSSIADGLSYDDNGTGIIASSNFTEEKIDLSDYQDILNINAKAVSQSVHLVGDDKNNSLTGGKADDTLQGNAGNDTLTGGDGSDIFLHYEGNDTIYDYKPGADYIALDDGIEITGARTKLKDVILSTTNGSITIRNGKNKEITVIDSEGNETTKTYGILPNGLSYSKNNTVITAKKSFTGDTIDLADYAETVKKVDAAKVTNDVEIRGNKLANSLVGGKGNDILSGGSGNDTLRGNGGNDIFVHYAGNDVIMDYKAGADKVQLDNTEIKSAKVGENDVIFTTSTGKLTIKNGAGKKISIVDSEGEESIYNSATKKFVSAMWFEDENNFAEIDSIIENKFAVAEFENPSSLSSKTSSLNITYAE